MEHEGIHKRVVRQPSVSEAWWSRGQEATVDLSDIKFKASLGWASPFLQLNYLKDAQGNLRKLGLALGPQAHRGHCEGPREVPLIDYQSSMQ